MGEICRDLVRPDLSRPAKSLVKSEGAELSDQIRLSPVVLVLVICLVPRPELIHEIEARTNLGVHVRVLHSPARGRAA